ncbi:MAG: PAS domain-containing protein, partial [Bdellovibrionaceae bacterium]|nr:PAS domain-containing protein [Pseudobdellovibrionaceae bacterium]
LDSPGILEFDQLTLIASQICNVPICLVSLVDESRQWFLSKKGISVSEASRDWAFCTHTILQDEVFIVPDASADDRFSDNPLVTGDPKILFYAGVPIISPDGFPIGTLCVIDQVRRELTIDQQNALRALANQARKVLELRCLVAKYRDELLRVLFKNTAIENLQEGVILQDDKLAVKDFNEAALSTLGLTAEQMSRKTSHDPDWLAVHLDGTPMHHSERPAVRALATGKKQTQVTLGVNTSPHGLKWLRINATPLYLDGSEKPTHVVSCLSDVTDLVKSREEVATKQRALRRLINGIPSLIGHWSRDLLNLNSNTGYTSAFGFHPDEITGMHMKTLLGEKAFQENLSYITKVLNGESQTFEKTVRDFNDDTRNILINYIPEYENSEVVGFYVVSNDVTTVKLLEQERNQMAAKVIETAKMSTLGEMAGGIAHEINTPLAIIIAKAQMLIEDGASTDTGADHIVGELKKIKKTAEKIAKIVRGLRLFSRNSELDPTEVTTVKSMVDATLDLCRERMHVASIQLKVHENLVAHVDVRSTEFCQVLMNLISNSIDGVSNLDERWIEIRCATSDGTVCLEVIDSGLGIAPEVAAKMMNPFFTTKEIGKGTGLGLSISKGIIENHGGKFWYDSKFPNTKFVIEMPLAKAVLKAFVA